MMKMTADSSSSSYCSLIEKSMTKIAKGLLLAPFLKELSALVGDRVDRIDGTKLGAIGVIIAFLSANIF